MADTIIRMSIVGDTSGVEVALRVTEEEASKLAQSLKGAGAAGKKAGDDTRDAMRGAAESTREAREAAKLFGEETGVRIPRALAGILARSETLGPILASAFSGVAVLAFAELAEKAGEKLGEWISNTFIFTDADKDLAKTLDATNKSIEQRNAKIKELDHEMQLMGKTDSEKAALKLKWNTEDSAAGAAQIKQQIDSVTEEAKTKSLGWMKSIADAAASTAGFGTPFLNRMLADIDTLHSKADALQGDLQSQQKLAAKESEKDSAEVTAAKLKEATELAKKQQELAERIDNIINKSHAALVKDMEKQDEAYGKVIEERLKTTLEGELKQAEATQKAADEQLKLNEAVIRAAAEHQADVVAQDKAAGNTAKAVEDTKTLVALLEKQKNAELAIVDAKLAEAQASMQVAFNSGGLESADFQTALAEYRQYNAERVQIAAEADKRINAANDNSLKEENKELQQYLNTMNSQFAASFARVAMGQESLSKAASKMYQEMTTALITNLVKAAAAELEGMALHKTIAAQKQLSDAKGAAAGAYNALAGIPYIGPVIAPIAAGAAFAAVMAFDQGGMVPTTQMALVHAGEGVLTGPQVDTLRQAADNGGLGNSQGGETHVHNTTIQAMDASSFQSFLKRNPSALGAGINHAAKNGHISAASIARGK
jgi:hypothetical protein